MRAAALFLLAIQPACGTERVPDGSGTAAPAAKVASRSAGSVDRDSSALDSVFRGTLELTEVPPPPHAPSILREVRTSVSPAWERVVFDFGDGLLPGYRIEYVDPPAQECGSGADAPLAGTAVLSVHFRPADAHEEAGGEMRATIEKRDRAPRYPLLRQMRMVCDFEGSVEWALGLAARRPYRVLRLAGPARLVVDIGATATP